MPGPARYDEHADWYEDWNRPNAERYAAEVRELLGPGEGLCLDLGCGPGHYLAALAATGRTMVGLDYSADQLRMAQHRSRALVQGDAAVLPFGDGTFSAVAAIWLSTDVDDFGAVIGEAARVLRPGGALACYLAHPCFNGPHIEWLDDGGVRAHPVYRHAGWHPPAPWWGSFVRARVGMRLFPLADLLNAFAQAGLAIEHAAETGDRGLPTILALRTRKPA
jgi:SAM-dependent methyltransferase